jgi:hypothetical protein
MTWFLFVLIGQKRSYTTSSTNSHSQSIGVVGNASKCKIHLWSFVDFCFNSFLHTFWCITYNTNRLTMAVCRRSRIRSLLTYFCYGRCCLAILKMKIFSKKTFIMLFTIIKIVFYCFYVIIYSMMINYMLCIWRNVYRSI